ncbi:MAG TPA: hypothetical protein P5533_01075 [Candidatus Cloacimonadota bacterium]|nr:hypothetical protein [Candidatus Cloacimonadota bacterium]
MIADKPTCSGGIPSQLVHALEEIWSVMPELKARLFSCFGQTGFMKLNVSPEEILSIIMADKDFQSYKKASLAESEARWKQNVADSPGVRWNSSKAIFEKTLDQVAKSFALKLQNLVKNYPEAWPGVK